jgi:hypothetical protein
MQDANAQIFTSMALEVSFTIEEVAVASEGVAYALMRPERTRRREARCSIPVWSQHPPDSRRSARPSAT